MDEIVSHGQNIRHLKAQMMRAATRISFEEGGNRGVLSKRMKKFDLGIVSLNKGRRRFLLFDEKF